MIPKDKALKLIKIYMYVCSKYDETLNCYCQRYCNNAKPQFTDREILTIYLFVGSEQRYTRIKEIHSFAKEYLLDRFPGLVAYQTFVYRLNRMVGAVRELLRHLIVSNKPDDCEEDTLIVDSMPIMTYCGCNRQGKVAREIADKGYCSTKNRYYHGLKLHLVGYRRKGHLPFLPSGSLWKPSTAGLSIKQTFKELKSAGLLIHTLGKLAIAFISLIFNY